MKLLLLAILLIVAASGCTSAPAESFGVGSDGLLASSARSVPAVERQLLKEGAAGTEEKVYFDSLGARIAGLLAMPKGATAAAVVLPGAGITKEMELVGLAGKLNQLGLAVLVLDQRGLGETQAAGASLQQDFQAFSQGKPTAVHGSVHDALVAFDILHARFSKVWFVGESNGGRTAVLAAAIEPRSAGALAMSTGGYGFSVPPEAARFARSISPESYIGSIAPRPLLLIHYRNDTGIPLALAEQLYASAGEPKQLVVLNKTYHGYDDELAPRALDELAPFLK